MNCVAHLLTAGRLNSELPKNVFIYIPTLFVWYSVAFLLPYIDPSDSALLAK